MLYAAPAPDDPSFPLTFESSWLIPAGARRPLGPALMAATAALLAPPALAAWGAPGGAAGSPAARPGAHGGHGGAVRPARLGRVGRPRARGDLARPLALLVIFWHAWLVLGVLIDLAVGAAAGGGPGGAPP